MKTLVNILHDSEWIADLKTDEVFVNNHTNFGWENENTYTYFEFVGKPADKRLAMFVADYADQSREPDEEDW